MSERHRRALELGLVADEVLDRRGDALRLQALDVGDRELGGQVRVLGVALEVAAVEPRALDVDRRRQQHPRRLASSPPRRAPRPSPGRAPGSRSTPSEIATGKQADFTPPTSEPPPRAPFGPSLTLIVGMPSRSTGTVVQKSAPASSATCSSSVIRSSKSSIIRPSPRGPIRPIGRRAAPATASPAPARPDPRAAPSGSGGPRPRVPAPASAAAPAPRRCPRAAPARPGRRARPRRARAAAAAGRSRRAPAPPATTMTSPVRNPAQNPRPPVRRAMRPCRLRSPATSP